MATLSHPTPLTPGRRPAGRTRPRRTETAATTGETAPQPTPYLRSALPLAISWFVLPALLLVMSLKFG